MVFDRYEIHIQAFEDFINAIVVIFRSSSSQFMIKDEVLKNTHDFQKTKNDSLIYKDNISQDVPIIFLYDLKHFGNS